MGRQVANPVWSEKPMTRRRPAHPLVIDNRPLASSAELASFPRDGTLLCRAICCASLRHRSGPFERWSGAT